MPPCRSAPPSCKAAPSTSSTAPSPTTGPTADRDISAAIFGDGNFPVNNTLFSNNTTADPYNPMQCGFNPSSGANDLQWPQTRAAGGATDTLCVTGIAFADPLLAALASNGGPTPTRLPATNSPLLNAGHNCPATDQRGNACNAANCTIGAVE